MFDVIVIGGGFAGIAASIALLRAGRRVALIDARPRLGGRASSFVDRVTGEPVDNGQHVMFGCYEETLALLDALGQRDAVYEQPALHVPFLGPDGVRRDLRCADLPTPFNLLYGLMGWSALGARERLAAARLALGIVLRRGLPGDGETVDAWLERRGQPARLRQWLWEPLAVAALNESPYDAAATMFVPVLREMFTGGRRSASLVLPRLPLSQMYAEPAQRFIETHGGAVYLGRPARVALWTEDDADFRVRAGDREWRAPAVIAAVPWHALDTLFEGPIPAPLREIIRAASEMSSIPIVTVNLWFDAPVLDTSFVGLVGRTAQWAFDRGALTAGGASHVSVITSAAAGLSPLDDAAIIETIMRDLRAVLPRAARASLVRATVIREKRATFSVRPGSPARPVERTPLEGLYLAGDWLRTGLPGTIEGAVRSGNRAGSEILCNR